MRGERRGKAIGAELRRGTLEGLSPIQHDLPYKRALLWANSVRQFGVQSLAYKQVTKSRFTATAFDLTCTTVRANAWILLQETNFVNPYFNYFEQKHDRA